MIQKIQKITISTRKGTRITIKTMIKKMSMNNNSIDDDVVISINSNENLKMRKIIDGICIKKNAIKAKN